MSYPRHIQSVISHFTRLPGIGPRTAARLVFSLMQKPIKDIEDFSDALRQLSQEIKRCATCGNFSEGDPCAICSDSRRNHSLVCIVSKPQDIEAIEKAHTYDGIYHLLSGTINALEDAGPEEIGIGQLLRRLQREPITEVIVALNPDVPGETTMLYIKKAVEHLNQERQTPPIKISRLARGLPMGADVEYADEITLENAIKERREI